MYTLENYKEKTRSFEEIQSEWQEAVKRSGSNEKDFLKQIVWEERDDESYDGEWYIYGHIFDQDGKKNEFAFRYEKHSGFTLDNVVNNPDIEKNLVTLEGEIYSIIRDVYNGDLLLDLYEYKHTVRHFEAMEQLNKLKHKNLKLMDVSSNCITFIDEKGKEIKLTVQIDTVKFE